MAERTDIHLEGTDSVTETTPTLAEVKAWFGREILPLEASLMQYLEHNWRNASDIADLRQEVYVQIYQAAQQRFPEKPKQYLFTTARNLLIRKVQHERVIPIEAVADLDALNAASEAPSVDRTVMARDELRRLQAAMDRLPPRVKEAVTLGKIEGLSRGEIALRMGVSEGAVAQYLVRGIRALVDILYGETSKPRRPQ
ncbi:MAG TPA: RNA polymerase sigma factor [Rhizomicrobium sp.]|nr:RNA polymerase sigma factor [Rhizomicrobium sp.]